MINFFKKYVFNFVTLIFIFSFTGFYYYLQHRKLDIVTNEETSKPFFSINDSILRINLVADTTITLNAFINTNPAKYRAIVVLDGSCSVCLETLMAWKRISDSLSISLKKIIFIGHNASKTELEYALQTSGDTNIPLFNDSFYLFGTKNKIQKGKPQTFLVNNNWQILETGDPLSNPSMLNKYTQKLKK